MKMKFHQTIQFPVKRTSSVLAMLTLFCVISTMAMAQKESVKPGINDKYRTPDVKKSINSFEREGREIYANREKIMDLLKLKPGMNAADIGAGTGFFSRMMAHRVAPAGTVYGVDISENFINHMKKAAEDESISNMRTVLCDDKSTRLTTESVDLVFVCDTYHHFEYPYETLKSIHQALRPGGILVIVDFERVKGISSKGRLAHVRCGKGTVTDEVKDSGFDFVEELPMMKDQWIRKFKKRTPSPSGKRD